MPVEDQQPLHVDSDDGSPYLLDSFLEFSGPDDGQRHWATAGLQPACTGLDPHFDDLPMWTDRTVGDALGSGHDEDGSKSERECHTDMVVPPCVNQQMPVEGSSLVDGSSTPQKPTSRVDADSTPTSSSVDGSSSRPDITNPAAQPCWVKLSLEDGWKRMLPIRICPSRGVSNSKADIDTVQVGILTDEPGWVPPSDMTSYDWLSDLAENRISESDRSYVTCVTIEELTDGQKNDRKRAARFTQEISHSVIIHVKAKNANQTRNVVKKIVRARFEKVFKDFEFEFEEEKETATPRWRVSTKVCKGHGENLIQDDENRMRAFVKLAIAVYITEPIVPILPFFVDSKVLTPPQDILESVSKKQKQNPPPASTEGLGGALGGGSSIGLGGGHFIQEQLSEHVSPSSPPPAPLPTSTNSAGSRQDTPSTPSDIASTGCLPLPHHLELVRRELLENFLQILERWPLDAVCLHYFLYTESAHFQQKNDKSFRRVSRQVDMWQDSRDKKGIRDTILSGIESLLPHPLRPEIDTVNQVLNFIVKDILKIDGRHRVDFERNMEKISKENAEQPPQLFLDWFESLLRELLDLNPIVAGCSMGIFFRMPSWLAILVRFILEHSTSVQEELYAAGYRRFAELNLTADATLDGDTTAAVSFSTFCGYNIQECPECVGDSISFSGRVSEQHLHLTKMLSLLEREPLVREYYAQATGGVQKEKEEEEEEEEEEKEEEEGRISSEDADMPLAPDERPPRKKKKDDAPLEDSSDDNGSAAELHDKNRKDVKNIYNHDVSRAVILKYLEALRETLGSYIDSASGERRRIDGSIFLLLLKNTSFHSICDSDDATIQEDLKCSISKSIMADPVECSDGCTYERKEIEKHFEVALKKKEICKSPLRANKNEPYVSGSSSPKAPTASKLEITELEVKLPSPGAGLSEQILDAQEEGVRIKWCKSDGYGDATQVWFKPNTEIKKQITEFMKKKAKDLDQSAEGEEERQIHLRRLGHDGRDGDSTGSKEKEKTNAGEQFGSAETFLEKFLTETCLACLTGPPASGKTVMMQQLVCTHAATSLEHIQMQKDIPLLPVFMRAAELSRLLSDVGKVDVENVAEMKHLVKVFLDQGDFFLEDARQRIPGVKQLILELFDLDHILICIDGLDEAAQHQDLVERIIDGAVKQNGNLHFILSTREHSYRHSRRCLPPRLGAFDVVNLQPLDKLQQRAMIEVRLSDLRTDQVGAFMCQLEAVAGENPELATSAFLLSSIIEVYKKEGVIPTQRVELYLKQVKAIVLRCIDEQMHGQGGFADAADALEVSTDYLGVLAFVCQMRLEKRDFTLVACARDVQALWHHTPDLLTRARELMFANPIVGLLTVVGDNGYRFSHLTLQEYLAAKCTVRLFGHDAQELLKQLQPLHSHWKRMVLQFAACMLSEQVFEEFSQLVLASDDGTGSHCELVQDFLKERGSSEKVDEMVRDKLRDKLQEIRDTERRVAGLCHPSPELRNIVLSEMKKFGVPPDPFAETDGTAAALRQMAEDGERKWHTRAAAVLSLVQMAQMDHCRKGNGRSDTLQWLLGMLKPDQDEDILYALVAGLGTLLKGFEQTESKDGIMLVAAEDEPLLLSALKKSANRVVVEAVADLKAYSDRLMDWVSNESSLIAEGVWPMRHLLDVFCIKTATSGNQDRAEKLGQQLFRRVHAVSEWTFNKEQGDVLKGLDMICPAMRDDRLPLFLPLLQSGKVKQRSRVMQVAAERGMQFVRKSRESLDTLAQALLSDVDEGCTLADLMEGGSLFAALLRDEVDRKHKSLRDSPQVFVFLMKSLGPAADQGLEAPKRVVDFLVEFEKNHLAAAAAAAAANRNETKAIEKRKEMNPEEKRTDKEHSEHLSLAAAVEKFTPQDLSTLIQQPEKPLNLYCAARLWATSGLMQERKPEEIAAWLSLSEAMAKEAEDAFTNLQGLKGPWVSGHECKDGRWLQNVLKGMRDEAQCLGRFMFTSFLEYIRERQMKDMSGSGIEEIEEQVQEWQPSGARGQLEQQLLLKEVRIGRRLQELPSWAGVVSAIKVAYNPEFVSLVSKLSSCLHSERGAMDLLDKETYDRIFKARASRVKGGVGGGGRSQGGQSEEKNEVERVLSDLHDFRDASGFWTSDWVLQVTVKQHDGQDDEEGEHIATSRITKGPQFRLYSVDRDLIIRITVKNLSSTRDISLMPVYVKDNGEEEPEELVELTSGDCFELPIPLQKEAGEEEDCWAIKDSEGKTVLKLRFTL